PATDTRSTSPQRNSVSSKRSSKPAPARSAQKSSWSRPGTKTPTRSRTPSGSPSADSDANSENPKSSKPAPGLATKSQRQPGPRSKDQPNPEAVHHNTRAGDPPLAPARHPAAGQSEGDHGWPLRRSGKHQQPGFPRVTLLQMPRKRASWR